MAVKVAVFKKTRSQKWPLFKSVHINAINKCTQLTGVFPKWPTKGRNGRSIQDKSYR